MPYKEIVIILLVSYLSGCANIATLSRRTELPFEAYEDKFGTKHTGNNGIAIHLDAKQRLVYAKQFGAICAEPSPDALSAVSSALSLAAKSKDGKTGTVSNSFTEAVANIGLRTQSIQLMRDALYRVCEAYYSRALNSAQLDELHKRYQDVLVGLLAIEQLTGAVAAKQAILTGAANSDVSLHLNNVKALLDIAIKDEADSKIALDSAIEIKTTIESKITETETSLKAATAGSDIENSLKERLKKEQNELKIAMLRVEFAQKSSEKAVETRKRTEERHGALLQKASTTASTSGQFSDAVQKKSLSAEATGEIAAAVTEIVKTIVKKKRISDKCATYLFNLDNNMQNKSMNNKVVDACLHIIKGTVRRSNKPEKENVADSKIKESDEEVND